MEPIETAEKQEMRELLEKFYGPQVRTWSINPAVYEALGRLIAKSGQCTVAMHVVPRPWDLSNPINWARKQIRQAVVRFFKTSDGKHYIICMRAAALGMRSEFEEAQLGL